MQVNLDTFTLDQLERFSFHMTPVIGDFGGRKFEHKSISVSINDLYKHLSTFARPSEEEAVKIQRILNRLKESAKQADTLLHESDIITRVITAVKSWIGKLRFDRQLTILTIQERVKPILADLKQKKEREIKAITVVKPLARAIDEMGLPHIIGENVVRHLDTRPKITQYPHYQKRPYTILTFSENQTFLIFKKKLNLATVGKGEQSTVVHAIDVNTGARKVYYRLHLHDEDTRKFHQSEMEARKRIRDIPGVLHFEAVVLYTSSKGHLKRGAIAPYYEKGDLKNALNLSFNVKERIMRYLIQTLKDIHFRNVNHRDIKLDNILLTDDLQPVIADLGFTTINDPSSKSYYYSAGTPLYASPELMTLGKKGLHNDVWSLGITLFALIKGASPKANESRSFDESCPFQKATKRMLTHDYTRRPEIHEIEI